MGYIGLTGFVAAAYPDPGRSGLMGRKNRRIGAPTEIEPVMPKDVVDYQLSRTVRRRYETDEERNKRIAAELGRKRERTHKRIDKRVLEALVDWDHCCIPGCDERTSWRARPASWETPNPSKKLPVCEYHETIIGLQVQSFMADADHLRMRETLARRHVEEQIEIQERFDEIDQNGTKAPNGQIYVIRQGGLIKVGWSSKLRSRLKQYGAGVEILAHYPATRAEETALHRSLRPFLARGREWYQDCPLLADVVKDIHKRHGEPYIFPFWTKPKADLSAKPKGYKSA